jgi:RsiW-degrading membrane proteinase PrsW (M82 family)
MGDTTATGLSFWSAWIAPLGIGVLPVLCFLLALVLQDSFKLVRRTHVAAAIAAGAVLAGVAYLLHGALLARMDMPLAAFSRYVAPLTEELLKGLVIVALIRTHRIGFLVDAAIFGFAVGAGFAAVENVHFMHLAAEASTATWIVRGFGTAVMHGGATALFGVIALTVLERAPRAGARAMLPALAVAALLHSAFNHLIVEPRWATLAVLVAVPLAMMFVFQRGERSTREWLGMGFDADVQLLELLQSGDFPASPMGRYLHALRDRLEGPVLADLLCYVRVYTELSVRAKGLLMMRENGFAAQAGPEAQAELEELRYLERSIGKTGLRAVRPLLPMSPKDLWQIVAIARG